MKHDTPVARETSVPHELKVASEWGWRLLILVAVGVLAVMALVRLELIAVSLFMALLLTALLSPLRSLLDRFLPRSLSVALTMVTLVAVLAGLVTFVSARIASGWDELRTQVGAGIADIQEWLRDGPFHLTQRQLDEWLDQVQVALSENQEAITSGALSTAVTAGEILSGVAITLFATIFFLYEGGRIWAWVRGLFPGSDHSGAEAAGLAAWRALTGYVRGTVIIAFADAVFVGIGLAVVGVPLAGPLAVLVFLGAFVPIVGALLAGFAAVAVALATQGLTAAAVVLVIIIVVQQVEGHVLQPVVMNKAVSVHPLGVILAVATGTLLAGIVGAVVAVPVVAVLNAAVRAYRVHARGESPQESAELVATLEPGVEDPALAVAEARNDVHGEGAPEPAESVTLPVPARGRAGRGSRGRGERRRGLRR